MRITEKYNVDNFLKTRFISGAFLQSSIWQDFLRKQNKKYWQRYYIDNEITKGPVNGEQYFVEDHVKQRLELVVLPPAWFTRWVTGENINYGKSMLK